MSKKCKLTKLDVTKELGCLKPYEESASSRCIVTKYRIGKSEVEFFGFVARAVVPSKVTIRYKRRIIGEILTSTACPNVAYRAHRQYFKKGTISLSMRPLNRRDMYNPYSGENCVEAHLFKVDSEIGDSKMQPLVTMEEGKLND